MDRIYLAAASKGTLSMLPIEIIKIIASYLDDPVHDAINYLIRKYSNHWNYTIISGYEFLSYYTVQTLQGKPWDTRIMWDEKIKSLVHYNIDYIPDVKIIDCIGDILLYDEEEITKLFRNHAGEEVMTYICEAASHEIGNGNYKKVFNVLRIMNLCRNEMSL